MLTAVLNLPYAELGILFVLYFVGGYLLYAAFLAGVGASVNEQEDASQFMMPVVLCMVFGMYAAMGSAENSVMRASSSARARIDLVFMQSYLPQKLLSAAADGG